MPDRVLAGLDPEQRLVAEALSGPVLVHAGAGTGKTRAITHRIAYAVLSGRHSARTGLAVTFTNRAAGEMRQRLGGLGVPTLAVRTFHAAALSQLRYFWPNVVGGPFPELLSSKAGLVGQASRELGLPASRLLVRDLAAEIEWAGSTMLSAGDYVAAAAAAGRSAVGSGEQTIAPADIARVMTAYQDLKSRGNVIDFEDVLLSMVAIIADRPDVADEIRRTYRWFTVDEYQDITPAQEALLSGWLGERDDVCVVGDASQTIYSFAGADPHALSRFASRWPHATEIRLDRCYRCTPQIVTVANAVIRAGSATSARADQQGGPGAWEPVLLRSQRPPGPTPEIVNCADDADEAGNVAGRIRALIDAGTPARDIAVLMRINAASEPLEAALGSAGIAYTMRGAERFFDRPEVREAMVRLRGEVAAVGRGGAPTQGRDDSASSASDTPAAIRPGALADPPVGHSGSVAGDDLGAQTRAVLAGMGWSPDGPASGGASRERWESLAAVAALADEVAASGRTTLTELLEEFQRRAQVSHAPTPDGVTVATLHAAKGLEWPVVFLLGCSEGSLPIVYADTDERIAEERRLFYVGVTRARDQLTCTWAMTRTGSGRFREPSRFLAGLRGRGVANVSQTPSGLVKQGRSAGPRERRRRPPQRCRVCGAGLVTAPERTLGRCRNCPGNPDERLAERLREWRSATAKARGVPAYVVFTDLTLDALAERRPTDDDGLLDIPGIGPAKLELYGPTLLALIADQDPEGTTGSGAEGTTDSGAEGATGEAAEGATGEDLEGATGEATRGSTEGEPAEGAAAPDGGAGTSTSAPDVIILPR